MSIQLSGTCWLESLHLIKINVKTVISRLTLVNYQHKFRWSYFVNMILGNNEYALTPIWSIFERNWQKQLSKAVLVKFIIFKENLSTSSLQSKFHSWRTLKCNICIIPRSHLCQSSVKLATCQLRIKHSKWDLCKRCHVYSVSALKV